MGLHGGDSAMVAMVGSLGATELHALHVFLVESCSVGTSSSTSQSGAGAGRLNALFKSQTSKWRWLHSPALLDARLGAHGAPCGPERSEVTRVFSSDSHGAWRRGARILMYSKGRSSDLSQVEAWDQIWWVQS